MTISMTGFAARKGLGAGWSWVWDLRSVNGKGLDLRLRVPDWIDALEPALRNELGKALQRGNVSLTLKVIREQGEAEGALRLNAQGLSAVLEALRQVEDAAMAKGVTLAQATAADVLMARGVIEAGGAEVDTVTLRTALLADLPPLIAAFQAMRAAEGAALAGVIGAQLAVMAGLTAEAALGASARQETAAAALKDGVARLVAEGLDPARLAQELALLAVKSDVTEELDRLTAHIAAARALLSETGQVGRKFDFLMQEFMREANTLCSKAQSLTLTRIGLDLKTVIDQLREQVQNIE